MSGAEAFRAARDLLLRHRHRPRGRLWRIPLARARPVQLGARPFRPSRRRDATALWLRRATSEERLSFGALRRALEPGRQPSPRARRRARRPHPAAAPQRPAALGGDARADEARRRHHPGDHAAHRERPAGPLRARPHPPRHRRQQTSRRASPICAGDYTRIAVGGAAGWQRFEDAYDAVGRVRARGRDARRPTRCCSISPRAPPRSRSSCCTARRAIRSAISRRCTGSACAPATCTSTSPRRAGPSMPGPSFFAPWNAGATILVPTSRAFDAQRHARHADAAAASPPSARRPRSGACWCSEDLAANPVTLREAVAAGEPLNPEVIETVRRAWGITIRDGYGQTETTAQIGNTPGQPVTPGSMGRPLPGYVVRLLDPDGARSRGRRDRARARPAARSALMQGYLGDDGALQPRRGRASTAPATSRCATPTAASPMSAAPTTCSNPADYRISPFELESVLIEHEAVAEAAVVPSPDPVRTALPKAFVVLAAGHAPDRATALAIFRHLRARLAPYKRVRRIEFAELPKTISGKIRRVELRRNESRAPASRRARRGGVLGGGFPRAGPRAGLKAQCLGSAICGASRRRGRPARSARSRPAACCASRSPRRRRPTSWRRTPSSRPSAGSSFFAWPILVSSMSARSKKSVSVAPGIRQVTVTPLSLSSWRSAKEKLSRNALMPL